jgi:hypothetical protein
MYTVHELIRYLSRLDPDTKVIIAKDAEGNSYSPLAEVDSGKYVPETEWSGDFYSEYSDECVDGERCLVLFPAN